MVSAAYFMFGPSWNLRLDLGIEDFDRSTVWRHLDAAKDQDAASGSSTEFKWRRATFMSGSACHAGAARRGRSIRRCKGSVSDASRLLRR